MPLFYRPLPGYHRTILTYPLTDLNDMHMQVKMCTHTHTQMHMQSCMHTCTHTHTHTHLKHTLGCTCRHARAHTHTRSEAPHFHSAMGCSHLAFCYMWTKKAECVCADATHIDIYKHRSTYHSFRAVGTSSAGRWWRGRVSTVETSRTQWTWRCSCTAVGTWSQRGECTLDLNTS